LVINWKSSSLPSKEINRIGSVYVPNVKDVLEKLRHIGNRFSHENLTTKRSITDSTVSSIPCECGKSYIGETGRPPAVLLCEHRQNLKESILEKSKLAQHAYEERHRVTRMKPGFWRLKAKQA
jgi:hypothetical protein